VRFVKWLITADLHYTLKQYDWLQSVAGDFDYVILAGDHLDIFSSVDGGVQTVVVLRYLKRISEKARLILCSGNHDLDGRDEAGERVPRWIGLCRSFATGIDGDVVVEGDTLFSIFPWWDGARAKAGIAEKLAHDALLPKRLWVWVYHAPPRGLKTSREGDRLVGEVEVRDWILRYEPDIVFCGHVHNAPFLEGGSWFDRLGKTFVFNAGRQIGDEPTYIIVDTVARTARWNSVNGTGEVKLDVMDRVATAPAGG